MTGIELRISGDESDCTTNCATTLLFNRWK